LIVVAGPGLRQGGRERTGVDEEFFMPGRVAQPWQFCYSGWGTGKRNGQEQRWQWVAFRPVARTPGRLFGSL